MKRNLTGFLSLLCLSAGASTFGIVELSAAGLLEELESCFTCHGLHGASTEPDVPIIGGFSATYMIDTMAAYRHNERPCHETEIRTGPRKGDKTDMCVIARELSEAHTEEIAKHLASEPFVRAKQSFDPEKAKLGKIVHDLHCAKCHEDGGSSPDDDAGILAGQWMPYLEHQLEEYGSGRRSMPEKMKPKFEKLDQADIENVIHYYGSFQ